VNHQNRQVLSADIFLEYELDLGTI